MPAPAVIDPVNSRPETAESLPTPGADSALSTVPAAPPAASRVFGDRLTLAVQYAGLLAGPGVERGLLGPRETPRIWDRHLLNCAGLADLLAPGEVVVDVGSGAGLPGIVLAIRRPDVQVVLVEPLLRRATFLAEVVAELGLERVTVERARAEELAGRLSADVVTARAVAPLDRLLGWTMPLLQAGGRLLALKGDRAETELAASRPLLRKAGVESADIVTAGRAEDRTEARVVVVVRGTGAIDAPGRVRR
jgi:16S rRNA (guanine527-N7)-methyltransferase